jgi:hypothetical protein
MGCSQIPNDECPETCEGLKQCFQCYDVGFIDMDGAGVTRCSVPSEILFLVVILPALLFFTLLGVIYILEKTRCIKRSQNPQLQQDGRCWKWMGRTTSGRIISYLVWEGVVFANVYVWLLFFLR